MRSNASKDLAKRTPPLGNFKLHFLFLHVARPERSYSTKISVPCSVKAGLKRMGCSGSRGLSNSAGKHR